MSLAFIALQSLPVAGADPNLFHLDWDRTLEVVATIALVAVMVERALSLVFEHRLFVNRLKGSPLKELIAFAVSAYVCMQWQFDALSTILLTDRVTTAGELITAAVIAGGSKGSVKLFRDVLGVQSSAYAAAHGPKSPAKPPSVGEAQAPAQAQTR